MNASPSKNVSSANFKMFTDFKANELARKYRILDRKIVLSKSKAAK
jgi:hypothetical protein